MNQPVIIPTEMKVCATCSYWDGERKVDADVGVVVVSEDCAGECLVKESERGGLHNTRNECDCAWEHLAPDEVPVDEDAAA